MRLAIAAIFAYFLTACASVPGEQTLGLSPDPDRTKKTVLVSMGLAVDAIGVYGRLPACEASGPRPCRHAARYRDLKFHAAAIVADAKLMAAGDRSSLATALIFAAMQYQMVKTVHDAAPPTNPDLPPTPAAVAYVDAIGAADLLINSADDRVRDGVSVNVSVAELVADLEARVAALP